ncbi:MAG: winged helix-turn-helix transcriptional regulator [Crocinitomicaceae bacterium]
MKKLSNDEETIVDNQSITVEKKMKKIFGHIDPDNPPEVCPIRDILSPVSDKWSILIIIFTGAYSKLRFNEIKKKVYGISSKTLSERLKTLERDGYLNRKAYNQVPIKVEYSLTYFGMKYLEQILNLTEWIDKEAPAIIKQRMKFDKIKPVENNGYDVHDSSSHGA